MADNQPTAAELDPEMGMIFIRDEGWYPIMGVRGKSLAQQAAEHAELNPGTKQVQDMDGNVLWRLQ